MGFIERAEPITLQLYSEELQRFRLAAQGHGAVQPPERHRERVRVYFDPLPFWYPAFELADAEADFPLHAITQRPAAMYHSWGSMNPWLRQIHSCNRLYLHRAQAGRLGLEDDDWAWVTSRHGRIKAQVRLMDGVNPDTCWTWNAIGKRAGAWHLAPDAPEATRSFLLNHLIDELLPEREGGYRYANADPVTGQAAWYDLRVRVERVAARRSRAECAAVHPAAAPGRPAGAAGDLQVRSGVPDAAMTSLPATRPARRLGLVIDLDTCVGCQACVVSCKEWNTGGHPAPLTDQDPYGAEPRGAWLNRVHGYEVGEGPDGRTVHFPKSCLHCEDAACVTVCPTGASYKRAEDGIVLVDEDLCIGCGLCAWACPYGARELDADRGVMKKCTLCIDRIYNAQSGRGGPHSGVRAGVPYGRAPLRRPRRSGLGGLAPGGRARRLRPDAGARLRADQQVPAAAAAPSRAGLHRRPPRRLNPQNRRAGFSHGWIACSPTELPGTLVHPAPSIIGRRSRSPAHRPRGGSGVRVARQ